MEAGCAFSFSGVNWLYLSQDLWVVRWYVWVALICWGPGCHCGSEQLSVAKWVCSGDGAGSGDPGCSSLSYSLSSGILQLVRSSAGGTGPSGGEDPLPKCPCCSAGPWWWAEEKLMPRARRASAASLTGHGAPRNTLAFLLENWGVLRASGLSEGGGHMAACPFKGV